MASILQQSVTQLVVLGPTTFKSGTDTEAHLSPMQGEVLIVKHDGTVIAPVLTASVGADYEWISDHTDVATGSSTNSPFMVHFRIPSGDLDTVGNLYVMVGNGTIGLAPRRYEFEVLPTAAYEWRTSETRIKALSEGLGATNRETLAASLAALAHKVGSANSPAAWVASGFDPSTHSQEALRTFIANGLGSGFNTGTDSNEALRDYLVTLIAPAVVGATSLSGSGFLADTVALVRRITDEPTVTVKYSDLDIVQYIERAYSALLEDLNTNTDHQILVRQTINIVSGVQDYVLPPQCGSVWRISKIITATGRPDWEIYPSGEFNFGGYGFSLEGNVIHLLSDWQRSETMEILYSPTHETPMHKGTATTATASTITLGETVVDGSLDTRQNCQAGYMVRLLSYDSPGYVQERIISAYDNTTKVATVTPDFSPTPAGTITYEVLPQYSGLLQDVVAWMTALDILAGEGNRERFELIERQMRNKKRALRIRIQNKSAREPGHFDGDTIDNDARG